MISDSIKAQIKPGAIVRVWEKITEGDKTRLLRFEGIVLGRKHGNEIGATFTVRSVILGVGVEKVYPINSPLLEKIEIINAPRKVHRAKLYYLRNLSRKETRREVSAEKEAAT